MFTSYNISQTLKIFFNREMIKKNISFLVTSTLIIHNISKISTSTQNKFFIAIT